jgi:hypothetical protein
VLKETKINAQLPRHEERNQGKHLSTIPYMIDFLFKIMTITTTTKELHVCLLCVRKDVVMNDVNAENIF